MSKPYMYFWTKDDLGHEWRVLIAGEYETHADGNNLVTDLAAVQYYLMTDSKAYPEANVPDAVTGFVDALLDDPSTYLYIQKSHEDDYCADCSHDMDVEEDKGRCQSCLDTEEIIDTAVTK